MVRKQFAPDLLGSILGGEERAWVLGRKHARRLNDQQTANYNLIIVTTSCCSIMNQVLIELSFSFDIIKIGWGCRLE